MSRRQSTQRLTTEGADLLTLAGVNDANLVELAARLGRRASRCAATTLTLTGTAEQRRARDAGRAGE